MARRTRRGGRYETRQAERRWRYERLGYGTAVVVTTPVPRSLSARTVNYAYPSPMSRARRVVRQALYRGAPRPGYVLRRFVVLLPHHLPRVARSYVSFRPGILNIHSRRQARRLLDREYNRRRYFEKKPNRRKGRNGQLESVRGDRLGLISEAVNRGYGPERVADAAMLSRALGAS